MVCRKLGNIKNEVSLLGYGCMRFPLLDENDPASVDMEKAQEIIDTAIASGITYFDTAYIYHGGKAEEIVGKLLSKHPRESWYIATKLSSGPIECAEDIPKMFEGQLKRLNVDYFDFYLMHNYSSLIKDKVDKFKYIDFLNEKRKEGKIRHLGFSFHDSPELLAEIVKANDWDFAQIQLNYLDWELQDAKAQYEILTENNIPVVVMEPVRGGSLASLSQEARQIFKEANPEASIASWAVRYVASLPNVMTLLSGMTTVEQVKDNVQTLSNFKPLTESEYKTIEKALAEYRKSGAVPCTACKYCMDCPSGVDIPKNFAIYNEYKMSKFHVTFLENYHVVGKDRQAEHCTRCGQCVPKCPQGIDIPEEMANVVAAVNL